MIASSAPAIVVEGKLNYKCEEQEHLGIRIK
jgi:hypothetical protein